MPFKKYGVYFVKAGKLFLYIIIKLNEFLFFLTDDIFENKISYLKLDWRGYHKNDFLNPQL